MIDTSNRGDWASYQDCFTFAEAVEFPADLTGADQRPWSQVEDERQWLRGKIQHPTQLGGHLEFLKITRIEVKGRRAGVSVATRQRDASIAIITLDAVMTDSGWRFIPVRNP